MGPAHSTVINQTQRPICVITFNMADLIYKTYHTLYIVEPGEFCKVEANPDAIGLKLGIIYETKKDKQELMFHRFTCNNDSSLTITEMDALDIQYYGDGTTLNAKGKLREMSVEPFNMAADTLRNEVAVAPLPSKAKTEMKALIKKVADTSETIIHKAATVIEHPVEFVKAHGNVDNMSSYVPPPVPPAAPVFEKTASDYDAKTNYTNYQNGGSGFNTAAFTTTTTTNTTVSSNNSTSNNNSGAGGGGLFGSTPQKTIDYSSQTRSGANGMNGISTANGQNRSPDFNSKPNGSSNNNNSSTVITTTSTNSKGGNRQQQSNMAAERASPVMDLPQSESSKALAAEKWEAELQRVKNEKKWEAEVARIKQERKQEAEDQERREAEEAVNQENIRQGKLQPQPKHRKKNGEEGGPGVVGAGGCGPGCIVS